MFKIKTNTAQTQFRKVQHQYVIRFSKNIFVENQLLYSQTKFSVYHEGALKKLFRSKLFLLSLENEIRYF